MIFEEQVNFLSKKYFVEKPLVKETLDKALCKSYVKCQRFPEDVAYQLTERYFRLTLYKTISEE